MSELIKANLYRIFCRKLNIILFFIAPFISIAVSYIKARLYDGYTYHRDLFRCCFEQHIMIAAVIISSLIYMIMYDYFDGNIRDIEKILRFGVGKIIISKLISIAFITSMVFVIVDVFFLGLYYILYGELLFSNIVVRLAGVFVIYVRICTDSILLLYLVRNFFIYVGGSYAIWIFIAKRIRYEVFGLELYKFSYKYQMSILASFGGLNTTIFIHAMPYVVLSLIIQTFIFYTLVNMRIKEDYR